MYNNITEIEFQKTIILRRLEPIIPQLKPPPLIERGLIYFQVNNGFNAGLRVHYGFYEWQWLQQ